jgi:hypothetical protein
VLWGDPVDVVATDALQLQHHLRQPLGRRRLPLHSPGDVVVLAKDAAQIAAAEEDRARAPFPAQAALLAEVGEMGGHHGVSPDSAEARLVLEAVDLAEPRAHPAAPAQQVRGKRCPLAQLAGAVQRQIGRLPAGYHASGL